MVSASGGKCRSTVPLTSSFAAELAVYKDMKADFLAEGTDHGTREIREILKGACVSWH
jgi:hypothetical protein